MIHVSVRGIIYLNKNLLVVQLNKTNDISASDNSFWCTPGGGLEDNESLEKCLERELKEELGVKPEVGKLLYIQQFVHNSNSYLDFFYSVENPEDYMDIDLNKTSHGKIEISRVMFMNPNTLSDLLPNFLQSENIESHITSSTPVKIYSYID